MEGVTLLGEAEVADAQRAHRLPRLDVPRVIQQKVIPGKKEGGHAQYESSQKKSCHPSPPGEISETSASCSSSFDHFGMENAPSPSHAQVLLWDGF